MAICEGDLRKERNLKNEDRKNGDNVKNDDNLRNEDPLKNEDSKNEYYLNEANVSLFLFHSIHFN